MVITKPKLDSIAARPKPDSNQLAWHDTEFYLFFHFGPNTFTNVEWGKGTEPEDVFAPSALDCEQWARAAKVAGARGVILTAKHHDGFCLFPSNFSKHTVRESKWRDGKGDVLHELAAACRKHDLKLGFYLSPWDRNHPKYGSPEYNDVFAAQLGEVLSGYGNLFEIWFDGANGEGPNGKKQVYDFHRFEKLVKEQQPKALIFSDLGPGCRWAGNEAGVIETETNWCLLDTATFHRGIGAPPTEVLNQGKSNGKLWIPAECDVSIRPGWFYHSEEDEKVKTPEQLFEIYLKSVGRGANLILNVPPDRRGLIHENDLASLTKFGKMLRDAFDENLAKGKEVQLLNIEKGKTKALTDGNRRSEQSIWWKTRDFVLDFGKKSVGFNCIVLREQLEFGQNIEGFKIEILDGKKWVKLASSTTVGARKILTFPRVEAKKIKVTVLATIGNPVFSEIEVFDF